MSFYEAHLNLNDNTIAVIERIAEVRSQQGIPMDADTIISGIANTYSQNMLEATLTAEAYDCASMTQNLAPTSRGGAYRGPE